MSRDSGDDPAKPAFDVEVNERTRKAIEDVRDALNLPKQIELPELIAHLGDVGPDKRTREAIEDARIALRDHKLLEVMHQIRRDLPVMECFCAYAITENPVYIWKAIPLLHARGDPNPWWVTEYLNDSAERITAITAEQPRKSDARWDLRKRARAIHLAQ